MRKIKSVLIACVMVASLIAGCGAVPEFVGDAAKEGVRQAIESSVEQAVTDVIGNAANEIGLSDNNSLTP